MQQSAEVLSKEAADIQALRIQNMVLQVNPHPLSLRWAVPKCHVQR